MVIKETLNKIFGKNPGGEYIKENNLDEVIIYVSDLEKIPKLIRESNRFFKIPLSSNDVCDIDKLSKLNLLLNEYGDISFMFDFENEHCDINVLIDKNNLDRVMISLNTKAALVNIKFSYSIKKNLSISEKDIKNIDEIFEVIKENKSFKSISFDKEFIDCEIIRKAHKLGFDVILDDINSEDEAIKSFNLGCDIVGSGSLNSSKILYKINSMSFLDKIKMFFDKDIYATSTSETYIVSVDENEARCAMKVRHKHLNGSGIVQGGALFTLADFAFGVLADSKGYVQLSLNNSISYLRPGNLGDTLTAIARVISMGNNICFYEVDIYNQDNIHIAAMDVTGYIKNIEILK